DGPYERLTSSLIPGLGSSPVGAEYSYRDAGVENGMTYFYELEDVETTGATKRHGPVTAVPGTGEGSLLPPDTGDAGTVPTITYGNPDRNQFRILSHDRRGAVLELRTEGFFAIPQDDGTVAIEIPGFMNETEQGNPSIPVKRSWVEAAPGSGVRLQRVETYDSESISGLRPRYAGAVEVVASANGTLRTRARVWKVPARATSDFARIVTSGYQESVKKALVEMAPLRWDSAQEKLVLVRRMVVRLQFAGPEESGQRRRGRGLSKNAVLARLVTRERGLHALRYEDLDRATRRRALASKLRLSRQGIPVPYHLEPSTKTFGPGSTLYFVSGGAALNPYDREAVYELESGVSGPTMEVVDASPRGSSSALDFYWHVLEREENKYYQAGLLDAPDLWLWDLVSGGETKPFTFEVSALHAGDAEPSLEVRLQGASDFLADPDHHVRLCVNGVYLAEASWNGKEARTVAADVPLSVLREGENVLEIENVGDTDAAYSMVMVDGFSLSYPRRPVAEASSLSGAFRASGVTEVTGLGAGASVLDLTAESPRWLRAALGRDMARFEVVASHRYFVAGRDAILRPGIRLTRSPRILGGTHSASYLAIGPRSYLDAASDLLRLRRKQGLRVEAVATEDIYDELGYGEKRPEAIRDFIAYAYDSWGSPTAPLRYVLLLGDGTYDFKNYSGLGARNEVPPLMVRTRYLWTASDPTLAAVHGEDPLPDLAIGRLPASSEDEVRIVVSKIVAYETATRGLEGPVVLVTDNPDSAGDFDADAREIATYVPRDRDVRFVSLSQEGVAATRASIQSAFDEGASIMSYLGHGGIQLWASENLMDTSAVPLLARQEGEPILLTMNCLNGYFHFPYFDSLSEALVEADGRGAVAAISPTGLSLDEPAHLFHREMMKALFDPRHERLGDALLAAEGAYAETGAFPELLRIYHLIGDPALKLR
ncbi:MAG TPA: C25 family cysteine peptidase, partial [Vicinamibacteria bacterium]